MVQSHQLTEVIAFTHTNSCTIYILHVRYLAALVYTQLETAAVRLGILSAMSAAHNVQRGF